MNLNLQPKYETNAKKPNMQPNATKQPMPGGRADGTNAGRGAGGTSAGGRAGRQVSERVKFSSRGCSTNSEAERTIE